MERQYFNLLYRIVDGAKYIDSLDPDDPKYQPAMNKYNRLYEEAGKLREQMKERKSA